MSHALRASCDAILVGIETVLADDPHLTVRLVAGASPIRVVLDSCLRIPTDASVLDEEAATIVITTDRADPAKASFLRSLGIAVRAVAASARGVDLGAAARLLRNLGVESLLVEGGARVITSLLGCGMVDRTVVSLAPILLGRGVEAVGDLGIQRVSDSLALTNRTLRVVGEDMVVAWDVARPAAPEEIGGHDARGAPVTLDTA